MRDEDKIDLIVNKMHSPSEPKNMPQFPHGDKGFLVKIQLLPERELSRIVTPVYQMETLNY